MNLIYYEPVNEKRISINTAVHVAHLYACKPSLYVSPSVYRPIQNLPRSHISQGLITGTTGSYSFCQM